jgi:hypothetical protein
MSAVPASTKLSTLSDLLTQLQDSDPVRSLQAQSRSGIHDSYTFRNRKDQRDPDDDPDQDSEEDADEAVMPYPTQWHHIDDLMRDLLIVPEVQQYPDITSTILKCRQQLTKLRRYGGTDYQGQTVMQIESVYNQLVDHIRPLYNLDDTREGLPLSPIERAMIQIVTEIVSIGRALNFIKFLQLETVSYWAGQIKCDLEALEQRARARGNQELPTLCQNLDIRFTQFVDFMNSNSRRDARSKYDSMVAHIKSFFTPENTARLSTWDRRGLNGVVICLLCFGRRAGFALSDLQSLDASYWKYANPHGYGTT